MTSAVLFIKIRSNFNDGNRQKGNIELRVHESCPIINEMKSNYCCDLRWQLNINLFKHIVFEELFFV